MSKERYIIVGICTIKDTLTNDYIEVDDSCELLNQQTQRIAELEEQLKQARNELIDEIIKKSTINSPYNPKTNKPKQVLVINLLDLKELRNK